MLVVVGGRKRPKVNTVSCWTPPAAVMRLLDARSPISIIEATTT
jgi:hypothetical protein